MLAILYQNDLTELLSKKRYKTGKREITKIMYKICLFKTLVFKFIKFILAKD
jgi:hypothetical protein